VIVIGSGIFMFGGESTAAWPAPIGHRQPGAADISTGDHSRYLEFDILDKSLGDKLQICRGC
jgi:hypothetical protein